MRRWGYHLSAAAAVLALAACSPSEQTNTTETEESGVTDTANLPGAELNAAIQAEEESLVWLEEVEGERALAFASEMNERSLDRLNRRLLALRFSPTSLATCGNRIEHRHFQ